MEKFLVVSNDPFMKLQLSQALREQGYQVSLSVDERRAGTAVENGSYDVILIDARADSDKGASLFRKAKELMPKVFGIVLGYDVDVRDAHEQRSEPDLAFLKMPLSAGVLCFCIARLLRLRKLCDEAAGLRAAIDAICP